MKIRSSLFLLIMLSPVCCPAQPLINKTLLTINGRKTEVGEFIRMYNKSAEPGKSLRIDDYLEQFVLFKLKVADAMSEGYDTTRAFRTELAGYRNQLAQNYLTDAGLKEKLLRSAYDRSLIEINAWHILVGISPEASPEDTLKAWEKAMDIRKRITSGESFEQVARSSSDDRSALTNGGNLGYFSVFQMIMPFEDAAYGLKKGVISQPVRSPYGYHIIKVTDRRPSRGRVKVAHIMKAAPPGIPEADANRAERETDSLYNLLKQGADFGELAKKNSDHKQSAVNGGEMDWFGTGDVIVDFSEAAFSLENTGDYTKPVRTLYGWHIIKLLGKEPVRSFEESRSFLESRINESYLNTLSKKSFIERLKKEYNFTINKEAFDWFAMNTDTLLIRGLRKYDRSGMPAGNMYTFADRGISTREFAAYIEKRGYMIETRDSVEFLNRSIETMVADQLMDYENSRLEIKYPDFRYLMNEFHDGILLFEISGKKIWNRISTDSLGLMEYYEENKTHYLSEPYIEGKIYMLRIPDGSNILQSAYKKFSVKKDGDALMLRKFNRGNDSTLVITAGRWFSGQDKNIDEVEWTTGTHQFVFKGFPAIINITRLIEPAPLSFGEVRAVMMSGWQEKLEDSWKEQLKKKYHVSIDNVVLGEVKKKFGQ